MPVIPSVLDFFRPKARYLRNSYWGGLVLLPCITSLKVNSYCESYSSTYNEPHSHGVSNQKPWRICRVVGDQGNPSIECITTPVRDILKTHIWRDYSRDWIRGPENDCPLQAIARTRFIDHSLIICKTALLFSRSWLLLTRNTGPEPCANLQKIVRSHSFFHRIRHTRSNNRKPILVRKGLHPRRLNSLPQRSRL